MTELSIPELSLVLLVGVTGSGKSTFARAHFKPTEVISSDYCRGLVADDENDQSATPAAFEVLRFIVGQRLKAGRLTVVDATNVQPEARRDLVLLAREYDVLPVAIVLDLPERLCAERNAQRPDRDFGPHVIRRQRQQLRRHLRGPAARGLPHRPRAAHPRRGSKRPRSPGPGCSTTYATRPAPSTSSATCTAAAPSWSSCWTSSATPSTATPPAARSNASHPTRRAIFLGDLVDRGPDTPGVLRLVMGMVAAGTAFCVPGNHEAKLLQALRGKNVKRSHGLDASMEQLDAETEEFRAQVDRFIDGLISHYVLDGGRLVVAHAGLIERYHGRASGRVREFCLYGQTTGETDEYGLPVRYPWAQEYRGRAVVLYGHTPVPETEWLNNTLCLDTGCVFGGRLTALNYPERTLVSVPATRVYHPPAKPFPVSAPSADDPAHREPDVLDIKDVSGSRVIETGYLPRVGLREAHAAAALEVMSRFALDPRWLLYLPPTMSPVATSTRDGLLEHPEQAFTAYHSDGVTDVLCEEKHMGSRAVLLICRTPAAAQARFGVPAETCGAIWTRTGRPFFPAALTADLADRVRRRPSRPGCSATWKPSGCSSTPNSCPGTLKAGQLLRDQYAAVGAAARAALPAAVAALEQAAGRPLPANALPADALPANTPALHTLLDHTRARMTNADAFTAAYLRYCWSTDGLAGVRVAPFQLLASEGAVYHERPHAWHLEIADRLAAAAPDLIAPTRRLAVDTTDPASVATAARWWEDLTAAGGEGMVVKPAANLTRARRGATPAEQGPGTARPEGPRPGVPAAHLRSRLHRAGVTWTGCASGRSATSARWPCASTPSAWRRWTGWPAASRCGGCTSASSPCWPWSPSRSTPGYDLPPP